MQDGGKMRTETFRCDKIKILLQWSWKVGWEDSSAVLSTGCSYGGLEFGSQHPCRVTHNSLWSSWHSARKLVHTPYTYMHMWFLKIVIKRWWTDCYIPAIHWILLNYKYRIGAGDVVYFRKLVQQAWDPGFALQQNVKPGVMAQACNSSPRRVRTEPHSKCERQSLAGAGDGSEVKAVLPDDPALLPASIWTQWFQTDSNSAPGDLIPSSACIAHTWPSDMHAGESIHTHKI